MIKSKERIFQYGEVFTSEREVQAMLNLVDDETHRIDSRFLEPACGDGNFLHEVLLRKLDVVKKRYAKNETDFKRYVFVAVSSIYGIDILLDNIISCRKRLLNLVKLQSNKNIEKNGRDEYFKVIEFLLSKNIIHGDALSLNYPNSNQPIIFSEWSMASGNMVKRTDYAFNNILAYQPFGSDRLFSDLGDEVILPHPHKTFPLTHLMSITDE